MQAANPASADEKLNLRVIGHAIDAMPTTRNLLTVVIIAALASFFDNMDSKLLGNALPSLAKEFSMTSATMGWVTSSTMWGMTAGSFIWGWIADKWGRRIAFTLTVLMFSVFSGLTAVSFSVWILLVIRFLTGVGLGGAIPVDAAILAEFAPARIRGFCGASLPIAFPVGTFLASLLGLLIVPNHGWRGLFLVGVVPALLVAWVRRGVPESPRWLGNRGRFAECRQALNHLGITDEALEHSRLAVANEPAPPKLPKPLFRDLFTPELWRRTIHTWIIWGMPLMSSWGMTYFMPTFFIKLHGSTLPEALTYNVYISLVAIAGRGTVFFLLDRIGRKPFTILGYGGAATFLFTMLAIHHNALYFFYVACAYMYFMEMGMCAITPYTPEVFPVHIRVLGSSTAMGIGRIGGAVGPLMIGIFMGRGHVSWIWVMLGSGCLIAVLATIWLGIETRGRNLEQLNQAATDAAFAKARERGELVDRSQTTAAK
jgi:putative MFS transporter